MRKYHLKGVRYYLSDFFVLSLQEKECGWKNVISSRNEVRELISQTG